MKQLAALLKNSSNSFEYRQSIACFYQVKDSVIWKVDFATSLVTPSCGGVHRYQRTRSNCDQRSLLYSFLAESFRQFSILHISCCIKLVL